MPSYTTTLSLWSFAVTIPMFCKKIVLYCIFVLISVGFYLRFSTFKNQYSKDTSMINNGKNILSKHFFSKKIVPIIEVLLYPREAEKRDGLIK